MAKVGDLMKSKLSKPVWPGDQPVPKLRVPAPVQFMKGTGFFSVEAYAEEWGKMLEAQREFFDRQAKNIAKNMLNTVLPHPGNIPVDLLPSTVALKAANLGTQALLTLRNRYIGGALGEAAYYVNSILQGKTHSARALQSTLKQTPTYYDYNTYHPSSEPVDGSADSDSALPPQAYVNSTRAPSLEKINDAGRLDRDLRPSSVFEKGRVRMSFVGDVKSDPAYDKNMGNSPTNPMRARFDFEDEDTGLTRGNIQENSRQVLLPFYITDLRPNVSGQYRTVFFQPLNLKLGETISPEWSKKHYIGRVDPVATYQSTTRALDISFKMVCFHPSDLKVNYQKIRWLTAMVYPEYDSGLRYRSGPVVRLRIGNIVNAQTNFAPQSKMIPGVPGIIENLKFGYDDGIWEIESDWQVPRHIDVSFSFTVLHDLPVGVLGDHFGTVGAIDPNTSRFVPPNEAAENQFFFDNGFSSGGSAKANSANYVSEHGFRSIGPQSDEQNAGLSAPPPPPPAKAVSDQSIEAAQRGQKKSPTMPKPPRVPGWQDAGANRDQAASGWQDAGAARKI